MYKFRKWVAANGGVRKTARKLKVSHVSIINWLKGKHGVSYKNLEKIITKSRGQLSYTDVCKIRVFKNRKRAK